MPRYYLNLFNDVDLEDLEDLEGGLVESLAAAKLEAIRSARDLMAEHVRGGRPLRLWDRIEVADEAGKVLASITFRELITIEDR